MAAPGSSFTQAQRLSCCFTLLNTMMLASAMWYQTDDRTADTQVYNLGIARFTTEELYISLMSMLTVAPVNLMIVQLFRKETPLSLNTPEMSIRMSMRGRLSSLAKYVAWMTVFLVSTSSAFFVLLYSMDWGKEKSDAWMKAFFLSFMGSSCVVETLQIFALAAILAVIFSLPSLTKPPAIRKEDLQLNLWNSKTPRKIIPPAKPDAQSARKRKELSKKSVSTLLDLFLLFVFVAVFFYLAQMDTDQRALYETQTLSNTVLQKYDRISTPDQFYDWLEKVLLPTLFPSAWYNGRKMKFLDQQFAQNTESFRFGPPRLTQRRKIPDTMACKTGAGLGWDFVEGNTSDSCWRFATPNISNQPNFTSDCSNNLVLEIPQNYDIAVSFVSALKGSGFVDKHTETLAIDINFYNPSLKLFSGINIALDHFAIGNLMPTATITSFKMFQYESDADYVYLFIHVVFVLLFSVMLVKEAKVMRNTGWKYFTSPWNALSCLSQVGTATIIAVFIVRYTMAADTLDMVAKSNGDLGLEHFVDVTPAALWDACFKNILGLVVFVNTVALLRAVRFTQTIGKLLALPGIMKEELVSFLVVAAVAFVAFLSSGHLIFGHNMQSYSDMYRTTLTLFEMVLGTYVAQDLVDSSPLLGPIYFSAFMIFIFTLLVNVLMSIICEAISADMDTTHDQELAEHMWSSFQAILGAHGAQNKEDKQGLLKKEEIQANLRTIREQLDESLDICDSILPCSRVPRTVAGQVTRQ
ncbi:polycystin-2-like protein 2 [Branchiostoma floridae x Branchiostoma belcheri]